MLMLITFLSFFSLETHACWEDHVSMTVPLVESVEVASIAGGCQFGFLSDPNDSTLRTINCQLSKDSLREDNFISREEHGEDRVINYLIRKKEDIVVDGELYNFLAPPGDNSAKGKEAQKHFMGLKKVLIRNLESSSMTNKMKGFLRKKLMALTLEFKEDNPEKCIGRNLLCDARVSSINDKIVLRCGANNLPMSTIISTLAHEIAHTVDVCTFHIQFTSEGRPYFKTVSNEKIPVPGDLSSYSFFEEKKCLGRYYGNNQDVENISSPFDVERYQRSPLCESKNKEHFADELGSTISSEYFRKNPLPNNRKTKEHLLFYAERQLCQEREYGRDLFKNYPSGIDRLKSHLSKPEYSNAVGCQELSIEPTCPVSY